MAAAGVNAGFMCSVGPGSASRIGSSHFKTEEDFVWACADAMREEYLARLSVPGREERRVAAGAGRRVPVAVS